MKRGGPKCAGGFTLIEAMIVVAIVALLAAVALPSYQEHVRRTHRAHARATLLQAAQWMERAATARGRYPDAVPAGVLAVEGGRYQVDFLPNSLTATAFTLVAIPAGAQAADRCGEFRLTHTGLRAQVATALVATPDDTATCWDR
ncbi:MAG: type IV pilin protein [Hydrogenophaga sp.]|jgi:type IV pilus assembly protein PilE|uniref:type IV pilin protein n=1 Tax=Hydrogenophaga intermedia TaxID=65786 RepID=UPI0020448CA3|nr:type IV pilin protein [Hydrogenophaga intermedia]MCM3563728.1 type IV pilin protein [Hydrogenophaga intermedia]